MKFFLHAASSRALHSGFLDFKRGFALLRNPRISAALKLASLLSGVALTILLEAFEVPLEGVVGILIPIIGPALDLAVDGIEFLVLPLLIAAAIIARLVPRERVPVTSYRSGPPPLPR